MKKCGGCERTICVQHEKQEQTIKVTPSNREGSVSVNPEMVGLTSSPIHLGTTAEWNSRPSLIGKKAHIYVYTDYQNIDGKDVPGIKIGDGDAYLIDAPFAYGGIYDLLMDHINNIIVHITSEERAAWNNKVRCYISDDDMETIVFTTD